MELRSALIQEIVPGADGRPDPALVQKIQEGVFAPETARLTSLDGLAPEFPGLTGITIELGEIRSGKSRLTEADRAGIGRQVVAAVKAVQEQLGPEGGLIIPEQGKKGAFIALNHPIEKVFFDTDIDSVAYGSILMSNLGELRRFDSETGRLRIAIAEQWAYETDDGSGLMSPGLAERMEIPQDRAFQFRLAGLFGEPHERKGFVGKGTLRQALPGEDFPEGVDVLLTMDNLKGRKRAFFEPHHEGPARVDNTLIVEVPVAVFGIREFSRDNPISLGDTILKTMPQIVIDQEILPRTEQNLAAAERAMETPRGLQELLGGAIKPRKDPISDAYRRRLLALQEFGDEHHLVAKRDYFEAQPTLLDRFVGLTDADGNNPLLGHDIVTREVMQTLGTIFREAAEGSNIRFHSGMLFPHRNLKPGECMVNGLGEGGEVIIFRQPINGLRSIQVLRNVTPESLGNPHFESLYGTVFVYSNQPPANYEKQKAEQPGHPDVTAYELGQKNRAGAGWDFDGDFLGWARAEDFPLLAQSVKVAHRIIDQSDQLTFFGREREQQFQDLDPEKRTPEVVRQYENRQRFRDLEMEDKYPKKAERPISAENMVEVALTNYDNVVGQLTNLMNKFVDFAHQRVVREKVLGEGQYRFFEDLDKLETKFIEEEDAPSSEKFAIDVVNSAFKNGFIEKVPGGKDRARQEIERAAQTFLVNRIDSENDPAPDFDNQEFFIQRLYGNLEQNLEYRTIEPADVNAYMEALINTREFNISMMLGGEVEKGVKFKKVCPINFNLIDRARKELKGLEEERGQNYGIGSIERYDNKYVTGLFTERSLQLVSKENVVDNSPLSNLARTVSDRFSTLMERFESDIARPRGSFAGLLPKPTEAERERLRPVVKEITDMYAQAARRATRVSAADQREATEKRKEIMGEAFSEMRRYVETFSDGDRLAIAGFLWERIHKDRPENRTLEVTLYVGSPKSPAPFAQLHREAGVAAGEIVFSRFDEQKSKPQTGQSWFVKRKGATLEIEPGKSDSQNAQMKSIVEAVRAGEFSKVMLRLDAGGRTIPAGEREMAERLVNRLETELAVAGVQVARPAPERFQGSITNQDWGKTPETLMQGDGGRESGYGRYVFLILGKEIFETLEQRDHFPRTFSVYGVGENDFAQWGEKEGWDGDPRNVQMFSVSERIRTLGAAGRREIRHVVEILSQDGESQGVLGVVGKDQNAPTPGIYQGVLWRETEHEYDLETKEIRQKLGRLVEIRDAQLMALPVDHARRSMEKPEAPRGLFQGTTIHAHFVPASEWETTEGAAARLAHVHPELLDAFIQERRRNRYLKGGDVQTILKESPDGPVILANIVVGTKGYNSASTTFTELERGIRLGGASLSKLANEAGADRIEIVVDNRLLAQEPNIRRAFTESFSRNGGTAEVMFRVDAGTDPVIGPRAIEARPSPRYGANTLPPIPDSRAPIREIEGTLLLERSSRESKEIRGETLYVLAAPLGASSQTNRGPLGILAERYPDAMASFSRWQEKMVPPRPGEMLVTRRDDSSLIGVLVTGHAVEAEAFRAGQSIGKGRDHFGIREVVFLTDQAFPHMSQEMTRGFKAGLIEIGGLRGEDFKEIGISKGLSFTARSGKPQPDLIIHGIGVTQPPADRILVVNLVGNDLEGMRRANRGKGFLDFLDRNFPRVNDQFEGFVGSGKSFLGAVHGVRGAGQNQMEARLTFLNAVVFSEGTGKSTEGVRTGEFMFSETGLQIAFLGKNGIADFLVRERAAGRELGVYVAPVGREVQEMRREHIQTMVDGFRRFLESPKGGNFQTLEAWRPDVLNRLLVSREGFQRDQRPEPAPVLPGPALTGPDR